MNRIPGEPKMVNGEHYTRLKTSVKVWNDWRISNPSIIPNLKGANLKSAELSEADLKRADLSFAILSEANLNAADLSFANLSFAILTNANLSETNLSDAIFREANLNGANLSVSYLSETNLNGANLSKADLSEAYISRVKFSGLDLSGANFRKAYLAELNFREAKLHKANLSKAYLNFADFSKADLTQANLSEADLSEANLSKADLGEANLSKADLREAKLSRAYLSEANLSEANLSEVKLSGLDFSKTDLRGANLSKVQALETDFTSANFTGTCLEDWNINSATKLDNIDCQYIYLKNAQQERRPNSGDFAPGEFTNLYQKVLNTVDLIFRNGVDWEAFAYSFGKIQVENESSELAIQSIEVKGDGVVVVRVNVSPITDKSKINNDFVQNYEVAYKILEEKYKAELSGKNAEIAHYGQEVQRQKEYINNLFTLLNHQQTVQKTMAENPRKVSNYDLRYSQLSGGVVDAEIINAQKIGGDIYNTENEKNLS